MSLNLTAFHLTANSNKPVHTEKAYNEISDYLEGVFKNQILGDEEVASEIFGDHPWVQSVSVKSFGVELGSVQHRAHAHIVIHIKHRVPTYSLNKLRERMRTWLNKNCLEHGIKGWHLYTKLIPAYQINYANKEDRWDANDSVEGTADEDEKARLEDDRDLLELTKGMKTLRVLEGNEHIVDNKGHRSYNKKA